MRTLGILVEMGARLWLGLVFMQSAWGKFMAPGLFMQAVENFRILPTPWDHFYATLIPGLEFLAAVLLLLGLFTRFAAFLTGSMLVSFMIAIGIALFRGDVIDCGCLIGGKQEPVSVNLLIRDAFMLMATVYLFFAKTGKWRLDHWFKNP